MPRPTAILATLAATAILAGCGGDGGDAGEDPLSSGGLDQALGAVREEAGDDAEALRVQVTAAATEFRLLDPEGGATAFAYSGGELGEVQVAVIAGSLEGEEFPLADVDAEAVDEIRDQLGDGAELRALTLQAATLDGAPRWTVQAQTPEGVSGFVAELDGSGLRPATGRP